MLQNLNTGINVSGNSTNQGGAGISSREASTNVIENMLSWNRGRHSFSVGGSWTQADVWLANQTLVPSVEFGVVPGDPADAMFSAANFQGASATDITNAKALYAILTGRIQRITADARLTEAADQYVVLGPSRAAGRLRETDFFVQDSWRARPNLTINLGVRSASPTGYGAQGPPSGRYLAPANGPDCIETAPSYGDCGVRSLVLTGPWRSVFDFSVVKRVRIVGNATFEFRAEMLNAFNQPYFFSVTGFTTTNFNGNGVGIQSIPISNASTNNLDNFRIVNGDTGRIIQLVWRATW